MMITKRRIQWSQNEKKTKLLPHSVLVPMRNKINLMIKCNGSMREQKYYQIQSVKGKFITSLGPVSKLCLHYLIVPVSIFNSINEVYETEVSQLITDKARQWSGVGPIKKMKWMLGWVQTVKSACWSIVITFTQSTI